jgi:hypothetical protein
MIKGTEQYEIVSFVPTKYTIKLTAQYIQGIEEVT